jgi:hypothetical protein
MTDIYADTEFEDRRHKWAPEADAINALSDLEQIDLMILDAGDQEIAISTMLEYADRDEEGRRRLITALIKWRQAHKRLKNRANQIRALRKRENRDSLS